MAERGKPRPALLRALGKLDPPPLVQIDGEAFALREIFKHDSWAATAVYQSEHKKIVCKFNRQQSLLGLPLAWLGRWLARREAAHYRRLAGLANVPALCGAVTVDGVELPYAVAHDFVEGHPLSRHDVLSESFVHELNAAFAEVHRRQMAYVDLHKRENILVGDDGRPYLIDFQVSWMLAKKTGVLGPIQRWWLKQLQRIDCYHLRKHERTLHIARTGEDLAEPARPWWIRAHRVIAVPLRETRRRLLVLLGVRKKQGRSHTEHFAEDAVRQESQTNKAA
jgi:hypothetical protein